MCGHKAYHTVLITVVLLLGVVASVGAQRSKSGKQEQRDVVVKPVTSPPPPAERRTALVIGNAAYTEGPLENPVNDATDMASALKEMDFDVTLLLDADLPRMRDALETFRTQLRPGVLGLFYFAGHGLQGKEENYLVPIGARIAREQDVESETMHVGRILGAMAAANGINVIILDACRDNPFARSFRAFQPGLGLTQTIFASTGSLIAYATAPGSVAADGSGRNSVYTSHLLRNMRMPNVLIEQVFKNVRVGVMQETSSTQEPWETSSLRGSPMFTSAAEKPAPGPTSPLPPMTGQAVPLEAVPPPGVAFSPSGTPNRRALVIGNGAYPTSPLTNPVNDATDMAALLRRLGFDTTLHKNADRPTMEKAVDLFTRGVPRGSGGLFFFAGHGVQIDGVNYLLPIGAQLDAASDVKYHAVAADWVLARMDESGMDVKLLLLDACRNNPLGRSFQRTLSRGLGVMETPQGALIAYATSPGKTADDGQGRNSPFTVQLLRELVITGRDIEVALKAVRAGVQQTTKGKQIPWVASSMTGDFYVAH